MTCRQKNDKGLEATAYVSMGERKYYKDNGDSSGICEHVGRRMRNRRSSSICET
jgi:hypothetical protein